MLGRPAPPPAATAGRAHPPGTPGRYRIPAALRRLVTIRRPLCEWPGCGHRATGCDIDHDLAWPTGPTCPCNLGPLCRRHHRIKQTGWTKTRHHTGIRWTSPSGRHHDSPSPWTPPQDAGSPRSATPHAQQFSPPQLPPHQLPAAELEDRRWDQEQPDDPQALQLRTSNHDNRCLARGAAPA